MTPLELTEAREALHLSQRDLSIALGVHPTVVNRWERGRAKPPPYLWLALIGLAHLAASRATSMLQATPSSRIVNAYADSDTAGRTA